MPVKPPRTLKAPWIGVWRDAQTQLEASGFWSAATEPLLDEYVEALSTAARLRTAGDVATAAVDREVRRALSLAAMLGLTPRRAVGRPSKLKESDGAAINSAEPADPFEALDELAPRRANRSQAS